MRVVGSNSRDGMDLRRPAWFSLGSWAALTGVLASLLVVSVGVAAAANVAVVLGTPITRHSFDHWMSIVAAGSAGQGPVIVPTDPPRFAGCISQMRRKMPSLTRVSDRTIRADCRQLFADLSRQALDYLIKAQWYERQAQADHIVVTYAQVRRALEVDKRQQFKTATQFRQFLRRTRQTTADVRFRVRVDLVDKALLTSEHLTPRALEAEVAGRFKTKTKCARYYVMSDCAAASPPIDPTGRSGASTFAKPPGPTMLERNGHRLDVTASGASSGCERRSSGLWDRRQGARTDAAYAVG
jgi:hypothetical protein